MKNCLFFVLFASSMGAMENSTQAVATATYERSILSMLAQSHSIDHPGIAWYSFISPCESCETHRIKHPDGHIIDLSWGQRIISIKSKTFRHEMPITEFNRQIAQILE